MSTPDNRQQAREVELAELTKLAGQIGSDEFETEVETPNGGRGRLRLRVSNRSTGHLTEVIYAAPDDENGVWSFWWGWTEPFAPVSDPAAAAEKIMRVLRATGH